MAQDSTKTIEIVLNGERRRVAEGGSVLDLLQSLELDPERVAVELDRRIIPKSDWAQTAVLPEARIELVQFVGGG